MASASEAVTAPHEEEAALRPVIEVRGVTHRYGGTRTATTALGPIDLVVEPGEFVVVVGASGCGKSTLLRLAAGFERMKAIA